MALNTNPVYACRPFQGVTYATGNANTAVDGTGTITPVFTAGSEGAGVDKAVVKAMGTTTASMVRLWVHDGSNWRLLDEIITEALTPSSSVKSWRGVWFPDGGTLFLSAGQMMGFTSHAGETFAVMVQGGHFAAE